MLTMLQRKEGIKRNGHYAKVSRLKSICIYYESSTFISIQNISLVLSCESHPKYKLKATDNFIKRTLRKLNNPCTRRYKHRCFIPGGNSTSPSIMFLSLKLDIRGLNPQSSMTLSLGVQANFLAKENTATENMQEFTKEQNIKENNQIYYSSQSEHSLIIHQVPTNSA